MDRWKHDVAITQKQSCVACMIFSVIFPNKKMKGGFFIGKKEIVLLSVTKIECKPYTKSIPKGTNTTKEKSRSPITTSSSPSHQ